MIRVAVVGLGIGMRHLREYRARQDARVVAVADVRQEVADAAAAEYGVPAFSSLGDLLAATHPDAVSLCTPPVWHALQVEELANAGVHVLVEKPMAPGLADCRRMVHAARAAGVCLMVGHKKRFAPPYRYLHEQFRGAFGQPRWAAATYAMGRVDKPWFWDERDGGGPIQENAIHLWDLMRHLMGEVESVYARGGNLFRPDVAAQLDTAATVLGFEGGGHATVACGYASEWGCATEQVSFATPRVVCEVSGPFDQANRLRFAYRHAPARPEERVYREASGFAEEIDEFVASIRESRDPSVTGEDAARSVAVALAVKRSARTGRPVDMVEFADELP